ncbi:hypothetical protein VP1G_07127 [Cytospora mali]|uniref:Myb-like DNA-binding domain-containing protein n=1 Tax=Cytospora mali TaxID=578113 RepID=A0A194V7M6_CYTMA|nr:hypothetical protein VP1G_07127 [Valsa mali var. pyri (nom. inval.)]
MASYENNTTPKSSTSTLGFTDPMVDEPNIEGSQVTGTKVHRTKTPKRNVCSKPTISLELSQVESRLFFNMIRFNSRHDQIDWEKVAEHCNLKNAITAKVRFRQVLTKHGLEDLIPRNNGAVGCGRGKRGRKADKEAGNAIANQDDDDGQSNPSPEQQGNGTTDSPFNFNDPQSPTPKLQAQFQTPQFGNGTEPQPGFMTPLTNSDDFSPLFIAPGTQQQEQQEHHQGQQHHARQELEAAVAAAAAAGLDVGDSPVNTNYYNPNLVQDMDPIAASSNSGTNLSMQPIAEQLQGGREQDLEPQLDVMQFHAQSGDLGGYQMGDLGGTGDMGDTGGIGVKSNANANANDQYAQMNQAYAANNYTSHRPTITIEDPRPFDKDPDVAMAFQGNGKWRIQSKYDI